MITRENTNYWKDHEITQEECLQITKIHRALVLKAMHKLFWITEDLWKKHDKDKEISKNLEEYTYLLNHPWDEDAHKKRKELHNYNNPHHVEWFMACDRPNIQFLIEMVCDNVATAIARNAKYENIFEENKERYMQKWFSENIAVICTNTFIDIRNSFKQNHS